MRGKKEGGRLKEEKMDENGQNKMKKKTNKKNKKCGEKLERKKFLRI